MEIAILIVLIAGVILLGLVIWNRTSGIQPSQLLPDVVQVGNLLDHMYDDLELLVANGSLTREAFGVIGTDVKDSQNRLKRLERDAVAGAKKDRNRYLLSLVIALVGLVLATVLAGVTVAQAVHYGDAPHATLQCTSTNQGSGKTTMSCSPSEPAERPWVGFYLH
jgi:hypothetical protein